MYCIDLDASYRACHLVFVLNELHEWEVPFMIADHFLIHVKIVELIRMLKNLTHLVSILSAKEILEHSLSKLLYIIMQREITSPLLKICMV